MKNGRTKNRGYSVKSPSPLRTNWRTTAVASGACVTEPPYQKSPTVPLNLLHESLNSSHARVITLVTLMSLNLSHCVTKYVTLYHYICHTLSLTMSHSITKSVTHSVTELVPHCQEHGLSQWMCAEVCVSSVIVTASTNSTPSAQHTFCTAHLLHSTPSAQPRFMGTSVLLRVP